MLLFYKLKFFYHNNENKSGVRKIFKNPDVNRRVELFSCMFRRVGVSGPKPDPNTQNNCKFTKNYGILTENFLIDLSGWFKLKLKFLCPSAIGTEMFVQIALDAGLCYSHRNFGMPRNLLKNVHTIFIFFISTSRPYNVGPHQDCYIKDSITSCKPYETNQALSIKSRWIKTCHNLA